MASSDSTRYKSVPCFGWDLSTIRGREEVTLDEYRDILLPLVFREFLNANEFDTKQCIHMTVGRKMIMALEIDRWQEILMMGKGLTIHIDPALADRIEKLSQELLQQPADDNTLNAFTSKLTSFKLKLYHDSSTLKSFVRELVKRLAPDKEFLADRRILVILAVDGLFGLSLPEVIQNYIGNLHIGDNPQKKSHRHGIAVRAMYNQIPNHIQGTHASYVVAKALLELYLPITQNEEEQAMIKAELERINTYLLQETDNCSDLVDVTTPKFIQTLHERYQNIVKDVQTVAQQKISAFKQATKKKNTSKNKKRKNEGQERSHSKKKVRE